MKNKFDKNYLDLVEVIILALNPKGEITLINRKGCEILGYKEKDILGKNWFDNFISQKYVEEVKLVFNKLMKGETKAMKYYENFVATKHGVRIIAWHNSVLKDDNGKIIGVISSGEDVTKMKESMRKLKESEEQFKDLFENAGDLIQSVDAEGNFLYVNKKWQTTLGYTKEEAKKINFMRILRKDMVPHCTSLFKELRKGKSFENINTVFISKAGKEIFVEGNINAKMRGKEFIETTGIFRDVTEKKKAKQEAEKFNKFAVNRELKMIELKNEINDLLKQLGEGPRYKKNGST